MARKEEAKMLKRMPSLGIEEVRGLLNQEADPYKMQVPAARRLVDLGATPSEIKETLLKHGNLGVRLVALNSLGKHEELSEEERAKWNKAWKTKISSMINNR